MLFVRLSVSVHLSVTLVDQDHIGWKSWKLIARTISATLSLFVAQKPSTYSHGNMGKFGGEVSSVSPIPMQSPIPICNIGEKLSVYF